MKFRAEEGAEGTICGERSRRNCITDAVIRATSLQVCVDLILLYFFFESLDFGRFVVGLVWL